MIYEWDPKKANANRKTHGISFDDAASVFLDPLAVTYADPWHSIGAPRNHDRSYCEAAVVFVVHCQRGERLRIISARKATPKERRQYEEGITEQGG